MQALSLFLSDLNFDELIIAINDTFLMVFLSTFFSSLFGIILGFILYLTNKSNKLRYLYFVLSLFVNIIRSIPFIILIILLMPLTVILVGTTLGVQGVIPVLIVGSTPFVARLVQSALNEIDYGLIMMAKSYGANMYQIIRYVLLPEISAQIIAIITTTAITLIAYTAMAGIVGGGGLGDLAIRYGYQRYDIKMMAITVILLVLLVQLIQFIGDKLIKFLKSN